MTHRNRARLSKLSFALIAALAAAPAFAQSTSAGIGGHVVGANGQPVAGAEVTITHVESGTTSRAVTDANGNYSARGLRVGGPYTVTVTKAGAGSSNQQGLYLGLNKVTEVDASLNQDVTTLGTVEVVGAADNIFSQSNTGIGTLVTGRQLETTPQGNRSIDDIARLDPRIQVTDQGDGSISAAGLPNRFNNISVDGLSQGDPFGLNANGMPYQGSPISVDTIAEYNISTVNYDVTSDTVGADINAVTKSGTNAFHGSVYYSFRNSGSMVGKLDGDKYTGYGRDWTGGFTLGGPIIKDKLFFFLSAEKENTNQIGADSSNGLDPSLGDGPSTSNNISPGDLQKVIDTATALGLQPGGLSTNGVELKDERYLLKLDWNINDAQRASFTYQRTKESQPIVQGNNYNSIGLTSYWYTKDSLTENSSLQLFSDWTDNFSTEAKVSYQKFGQIAGNAINQPQVRVYLGSNSKAPYVYLGEDQYRHENEIQTRKWSVFLAGTWYLGDHTVKGGIDYQRVDIYNLFGRTEHGAYDFYGLDNFALGNYASYSLYQPAAGYTLDDVAAKWVYSQLSPFLQDTWQVNDNFAITYGVRVDIPHSDHKPLYNAEFESAFGYPNDNALDSGNKVIEPRFSFNYTFDSERKTQLRGGIGLFQTTPPTVWMTNPYQNNGLTVNTYQSYDPADAAFSPDPYDQNLPPPKFSAMDVDTIARDFKLPTVWKASLAFDRELPWWGLIGSVELQHIQAKDAIFYQAINIGAPTQGLDGSPALLPDGRLQYWCTPGESYYKDANCYRNTDFTYDSTLLTNTSQGTSDSLTVSLTKPFSENWYGNISATLAHATEVNPGNSSQASSGYKYVVRENANEEFAGIADRNIPRSLKASLTWEHAFFGDYKTTVSAFYNGHDGLPYSWIFSGDVNGDGISYQDPVYIPLENDPLVTYGSASSDLIQQFQNFISSDDYLSAHRGQIAGRNRAHGPWVNQLDLGIQQELPGLFKGNKAILRLDVYNFLNLLNNSWGVTYRPSGGFNTRTLAGYDGVTADGKYIYYLPKDSDGNYDPQQLEQYDAGRDNKTRVVSRWSLLMTLRYQF